MCTAFHILGYVEHGCKDYYSVECTGDFFEYPVKYYHNNRVNDDCNNNRAVKNLIDRLQLSQLFHNTTDCLS